MKVKKILLRLPVELADIVDERVRALRARGYPASRTFVLVQAVEQALTLTERAS